MEERAEYLVDEVHLALGEDVIFNGQPAKVMGMAAQSITIRPQYPTLQVIKGVKFQLHRTLDNGDLVLRPVSTRVRVIRARPEKTKERL